MSRLLLTRSPLLVPVLLRRLLLMPRRQVWLWRPLLPIHRVRLLMSRLPQALLLDWLFARRLLLANRLASLIVRRLLSAIAMINLFRLNRGLLLMILLISQVLGPHHGPVILRLRMLRPILVLANPVGMISGHPVRILIVPPLAVVPVVLGVVSAVLVPPIRLP